MYTLSIFKTIYACYSRFARQNAIIGCRLRSFPHVAEGFFTWKVLKNWLRVNAVFKMSGYYLQTKYPLLFRRVSTLYKLNPSIYQVYPRYGAWMGRDSGG